MFRWVVLILMWSHMALAQAELTRGDFGPFGRSLNDKNHGYKVIVDPTGKSPVYKIEHFKVKNGDCSITKDWSDCANDRERSELSEKQRRKNDGTTYWYGWSFYLPESYLSIYPAKVALGQFHQDKGSPLWMFQHGETGLSLEGVFLDNNTLFALIPESELRGRWQKIEMEVHWSTKKDGFLRLWVNGQQKVDYKGPTKQKSQIYFKYGLYRSFLKRYTKDKKTLEVPEQEIYFANVKRGKTRKSLEASR
ncbi:polysaccharide lyase [Bdellovibrio sp. HCB2-146]|uniref:polysaccharide lyase n=1 Tax=Bdellovibrio sp. HCB2-146 TaxID=3394362 RepID=UPI0039BD1F00